MLVHVGQIPMECTLKVKNPRKTSASLIFLINGNFRIGKSCPPSHPKPNQTPFFCVDQDTELFKKYFAVFTCNINLFAIALSGCSILFKGQCE